MEDVQTADTYEAAWYLLNGGFVKEIDFRRIAPNRASKVGYSTSYVITMSGVKPRFVRYWREHKAWGRIRAFSDARLSLKRKIDKVKKRRYV